MTNLTGSLILNDNLDGNLLDSEYTLTGKLTTDSEYTLTGTLASTDCVITGFLNNATLRGIPVELQVSGTWLQWKYQDETTWRNLININDISYEELQNLPSINGVRLVGNKTLADLNIASRAEATTASAGLMSATDKAKLNSVQNGAQANVIETVAVNGSNLPVSGKRVNVSVPTNNNQLTNGAGYQNAAQVENAIIAKGYQTSAQVESAIAEKGYQTSSQVESAITSKGYQTAEQVDHTITQKGYQTSAQVESAITSKGYQTASQVESAITSKGYQTASQVEDKIESYGYQDATDVENKVESYGYQTASDVESKVEGYGYQTESDVATKVESYGYQTAADVDAVLPKKVSDLTNDAEYTTKQYVDNEIAGITIEVDPTLSQQGKAADAKAVGDAVSRIDSELDSKQDVLDFGTPTSADVGKALMPKTVENGEVTEWEFGEAGKVDDVQVNGVSVLNNKVANVPIGNYNTFGVAKIMQYGGLQYDTGGGIKIDSAASSQIKAGTNAVRPLVPVSQHESAFYGLAKAAGYDEKNSSLPVGQYTTEAKSAIKTMLDIPTNNNQLTNGAGYQTASDVFSSIATALGDITTISYHVCTEQEFDPDTLIPTLQGEVGVVYLVPRTDAIAGSAVVGQTDLDEVEENNVYLEFIYIDGEFEKIGAIGDINLDGYVTDDDIATDASVQAMLDEIGL